MFRAHVSMAILAGLSAACMSVDGRAQAADVTSRLKIAIVPSPESILSRSDVSPRGGSVRISKQGVVIPKSYVSLYKTPSHTVTVAGGAWTLRRTGSRLDLKDPGGSSARLTKKGTGLGPVPVTLSDRRKYVLAFPYASKYAVAYRSGTVQTASVGGQALSIYDDNMDGFYGTDDSFQVGRTFVFAPISGHFATPSAVYRLGRLGRDGSEITYSRYGGDTGELSLKCSGAAFTAHVAVGSDEADLNLVLTSGGPSSKAIPGSYRVLYGLAYSSAKRKACAGIMPGGVSPVEVAARGRAKVVLGGPFVMEFRHTVQGRKFTVSPSSVKLKGKAGEEYVSFNWQGAPHVKIVSGRRALSSGSMRFG